MHDLLWSQGRDRYDVWPSQRAGSLRQFATAMRRAQAPSKARAGYICAPLGGDGHRRLDNAQPRNWLAIDLDHMDAEALPAWRLFAARFLGFGWPTARSTPEQPRERVIVVLDRAIDRDEGIRLGQVLTQMLAGEFGASLWPDPSTFRAEQPCFVALAGARHFYLMGEPLDVQALLALAPPPRPPLPMPSPEQARHWDARFRWVMEHMHDADMLLAPLSSGLGFRVSCPWAAQHSEAGGNSSTALLLPSEGNAGRGGFRCLHGHCATRGLRDVVTLFELLEHQQATHSEASSS